MTPFTFNISLSVLNHLGRNLYRNFITVLGEAISNSWDADANNVWIYINRENNSLIIKDDGLGMTSSEFQNKFLKIGYSKRKDGETKTEKGRPYIGRKGIGKLALLSCAEKIHVISKTKDTDFVGGIIDNSGLDKAIDDDLVPQAYKLNDIDFTLFEDLKKDLNNGTIIYFEEINEGIKNRVEYIRKLIALYFRFSLIDKSFQIHLNNEPITLNELNDLSLSTQFVWQINNLSDPYLIEKIGAANEQIIQYSKLKSSLQIHGFIASVTKPSFLKIRATNEKVTVDLYVNGRLREKDLLKHIPSTRIVESYLYGQIHFDQLDGEKDRFTSSREGVISDDTLFQSLLEELKKNIVKQIIDDWDKWRIEINQDGDSDNVTRLTKKERKSQELFNTVVDDFVPPKESLNRNLVDDWIKSLNNDAQFNLSTYAECFVSENLLRKYIKEKKITISKEAKSEFQKWQNNEINAKNKANISFEIRRDADNLNYLSMDQLANLADMHKEHKITALSRDAVIYKPVRDAMAHTSVLTTTAKNSLSITYENIKARIKKLLA